MGRDLAQAKVGIFIAKAPSAAPLPPWWVGQRPIRAMPLKAGIGCHRKRRRAGPWRINPLPPKEEAPGWPATPRAWKGRDCGTLRSRLRTTEPPGVKAYAGSRGGRAWRSSRPRLRLGRPSGHHPQKFRTPTKSAREPRGRWRFERQPGNPLATLKSKGANAPEPSFLPESPLMPVLRGHIASPSNDRTLAVI